MAKRFTDTDKWKDEWYTELPNDYKIIWQYLLDTCDNAGIVKRNIKILNIMCNTNVSADDILNVFKDRVTQISDDKWIINKFCVYQYGNDFLQSKNKAVISAVNKLIDNNLYNNSTNTILIPYQYSMDTPKEEEEDKDKDKLKDIDKSKSESKSNNYGIYYKLYKKLTNYETEYREYEDIYFDIQDDIGCDKFFEVLKLSDKEHKLLDEVITIKLR